MKYIQTLTEKGKLKWHNSDAPEADGKFRDLSPKDLAAWLIKTRKGDMKRISGSLSQQVAFNQNDDKEYVKKMDKTRKEVYKQLDREDLLESVDMDDLKNAKERLSNPHTILDITYDKTRRGDKFVRFDYENKYVPGKMVDSGPHFVKVFYGNDKDLKKISKELGMDLNESVLNEEDTWNDYPAAAKKNAQKAIDWKEKYGRDEVDAGTPVGWARAHQLAKGENLSTDTVKRMSAFNRHRKNSSIKPELKETPWKDRGYVAWLIWGGDEGVDWAIEKSKEIDAMKESKQMKYIKPLSEAKMPKKYIGNDEIVYLKTKEDSRGANYNLYYKGHDIDKGGHRFGSEKELEDFAANYILSNQLYKKLRYEDSIPLPESIEEAKRSTVHKAAKKGSYPAVIVVVQDGEVIHQEPVSTPDVAPATFNVMQEKYPKALLHLEDKTGKRLFSEAVVTEAKAYKLKASEFGGDTHSAAYNVKGESTWRVHSTYAIDQVSGENNPEERDVVFFEAFPYSNEIIIKIGGINNLKRTNGSTYGKNFGTTVEEWEKDPKGIAKEASDFLTDADHLKWINKKARSEGQTIKWALKDDYSSVIIDLVNKALGLGESVAEAKSSKEKFEEESNFYQEMINDPKKRVYDIVDFAQFTTGGMTEKQWEMFMYGRYKKHLQSRDAKIKEKMYDVLTKWLTESVDEAFIGPFVFNDRMSDEELKAMYNGALDGYANYSKGFQHSKSDYKKAYQEIEKILKKRGVSVDESVVVKRKLVKTLNEYFGGYEYDKFTKEFGKIKYPKYIGVKMKELVAGGFLDKVYNKEANYMAFWLNQMGKRKFDTDARKKELGEVGYKLTDRYWHDLTGSTAFTLLAAEAACEVSKHVEDLIANKEAVEPAYYLMKEYFNNHDMETNRSRIFAMAVEKLEKWMTENSIETL